jgi:hypothetical protein
VKYSFVRNIFYLLSTSVGSAIYREESSVIRDQTSNFVVLFSCLAGCGKSRSPPRMLRL